MKLDGKRALFLASILFSFGNTHAQVPALDTALAPFYHGVASGDPTLNRVVLWTRVTPPATMQVPVSWRVALDTAFTQVVKSGTTLAKPYHDYTVKVSVTGLKRNTWYYYQFMALGKYSITGRTRTLQHGMSADSIRMAVVSCSNFQTGYFHAYRSLAMRNDVDVILHLGDYIYEYGTADPSYNPSVNRGHVPAGDAVSKSDYLARYSQYRLDPDLRFLHQQYPVICIWDDHEVANNAYKDGAENHDPVTQGNWLERMTAGRQAYLRWLPIRKPNPNGDSARIYRKFDFGKLIRLNILDTRLQGRTEQLDPADPNFSDTTRTMLGQTQRDWLFSKNNNSSAKWNIVAQQVMVAPMLAFGGILNNDQWDGYPAEKDRLYDNLTQNANKNFVVLTGDIHSGWGNDLPLPGYGIFNRSASAGVEFVTPSVTAPNPYGSLSPGLIQLFNSHARYVDLSYNGYQVIDVNHSRVQCDWYGVSTITSPTYTTSHESSWYVNDGERFLREAAGPSVRPASFQVPFAPGLPMPAPPAPARTTSRAASNMTLLGMYPNPVRDLLQLQAALARPDMIRVAVYDMQGRKVYQKVFEGVEGVRLYNLSLPELPAGAYLAVISSESDVYTRTMIRKQP